MVKKIVCFTLFLLQLSVDAQINVEANCFADLNGHQAIPKDGYLFRSGYSTGSYYGLCYQINAGSVLLGVGAGKKDTYMEHEVDGSTPGVAFIHTQNTYYAFPLSISFPTVNVRNFRSYTRRRNREYDFSITYIPSFLNRSASIADKGLLSGSDGIPALPVANFQHTLNFSILYKAALAREIDLMFEPFIGVHNSYFKNYRLKPVDGINFGISLRMVFKMNIRLVIERGANNRSSIDKKKLLEKQKEIERKINEHKK